MLPKDSSQPCVAERLDDSRFGLPETRPRQPGPACLRDMPTTLLVVYYRVFFGLFTDPLRLAIVNLNNTKGRV